tara:strand:- start:1114 stop:1467 length:354 start_codon:yes stop_codon:yes gene_type:complete
MLEAANGAMRLRNSPATMAISARTRTPVWKALAKVSLSYVKLTIRALRLSARVTRGVLIPVRPKERHVMTVMIAPAMIYAPEGHALALQFASANQTMTVSTTAMSATARRFVKIMSV